MPSTSQQPSPSWIRDLVGATDPSKSHHPYSRRDSSPKSLSYHNISKPHPINHRDSFDGAIDLTHDTYSSNFNVSLRTTESTPSTNPSWAYYGMERKQSVTGPLGSLATVCDALSPIGDRSASISSSSDQDYFGDVNDLPSPYAEDAVTTPSSEHGHGREEFESADMKKARRGRILMDPLQSKHLFSLWETTYFPTTNEREELAKVSGLSARQVQVWFQNQRQKQRRVLHDPLATEDDKAKLGDLRHSPRTRRRLTLHDTALSPNRESQSSNSLQLDTRPAHFARDAPSTSRATSPYPFAFRAAREMEPNMARRGSLPYQQPQARYPNLSRTHTQPLGHSIEASGSRRGSLAPPTTDMRRASSASDRHFGETDFNLLVAGKDRESVYSSLRDAPVDGEPKIELPALNFTFPQRTDSRNSSHFGVAQSHFTPATAPRVRLPSFAEMFGGM